MTGNCVICNIDASLKCQGCQAVTYCGVEHQKNHWKSHKIECKPYEVSSSPELNRFVRASRDIPAGTIIFTEVPAVVGHKWSLTEEERCTPIVPCVGCFKHIRIGGAKCPKCTWPACSSECKGLTDPSLHAIECPILSVGKPPTLEIDPKVVLDYYRTDALLALRCLGLQRSRPKQWKQLMEMESHINDRKNTSFYEEAEERVVQFLISHFLSIVQMIEVKTNTKILPQNDSKILHKICGIIEVNFMTLGLSNGQEISGVYPTGCQLQHSCQPNCLYTFDNSNGYKIKMRAGRDIKKGESLSIMYTHMLWGTQLRREHLKRTKYFSCTCARCIDPTELGTYISALKCIGDELKTCGGTQLPIDPLSITTDWACDKCSCRVTDDEVNFIMCQMDDEVDAAVFKEKPLVKELEELIDKLSQLLHSNHYHLFALKHSLIQLYGHQAGYLPEQMSDELMMKKITMCNDMMKVVDVIDPYSFRLALYTSIILYELSMATMQFNLRKLKRKEGDVLENCKNMYEAKSYLDRAKQILENEFDSPQGQKLNEAICTGYNDLMKIFEENDLIF